LGIEKGENALVFVGIFKDFDAPRSFLTRLFFGKRDFLPAHDELNPELSLEKISNGGH
jgi:hypothetical protein